MTSQTDSPQSERRRAPRFAVGHDCHLFKKTSAPSAGRHVYSGATRDLSSTGLLVDVMSPPPAPDAFNAGELVLVVVSLHGAGVVEMTAEVVRVERAANVRLVTLALTMADMSAEDRAAYDEYVAARRWRLFFGDERQPSADPARRESVAARAWDKRRERRVPGYFRAAWETPEGRGEGTVRDLSAGGCHAQGGRPPGVGSPIKIVFELPTGEWAGASGVVAHRARTSFGIKFRVIKEDSQRKIEEFLSAATF